ncbi:MAG: transglutaminase domain-containing protein [Clostridiales bacterium]|nr:transglutaminase domain-containing protein [Clostridiales bacterium]
MKIRLFGFAVLTAINIYVTYSLWDTLLISTLPVCLILLSVFCSGLFLINVKSTLQRTITYFLAVVIMVIGLCFAIYYRRPLGFLAAFSSATVIGKNFICGPNSKDRLLTKIVGAILLVCTVVTIAFTGFIFSYTNKSLVNGTGVLWDANHEKQFDEICSGALTDEEKAKVTYAWILNNITYDYNCNPFYQYSDLDKTLQTKKGICYDIANLFTAICRSQNIPCYSVDGYRKDDYQYKHTWNRVCIDGVWYNVDITADLTNSTPYGFYKINSYDSSEEEFNITRIY